MLWFNGLSTSVVLDVSSVTSAFLGKQLTLMFVKWKQHSFPYNTSHEELRSQSYSNEV